MTLKLSVADQDGGLSSELREEGQGRAPEQRAEPSIRAAKGHQMLSLISQSQPRRGKRLLVRNSASLLVSRRVLEDFLTEIQVPVQG